MGLLKSHVVDKGLCIGCGNCIIGNENELILNKYGMYQVIFNSKNDNEIICPFWKDSKTEYDISKNIYNDNSKYNYLIGFYEDIFVSKTINNGHRFKSSSGGIITQLSMKLLSEKVVDGVIHVRPSKDKNLLFKYAISYSIEDVLEGSKSRYYPVEFGSSIDKIYNDGKKYLFIGLPCFIKALRLRMENDEILNNQIKYCFSLVCGHLKSDSYTKMLAWQLGAFPSNLSNIDFRVKNKEHSAASYSIKVIDYSDEEFLSGPVGSLYGTDWGMGLFKYRACDYCDDIFADTADLVSGDAWIEPYVNDWLGHNIIILRNKELKIYFDSLVSNNIISRDEVTEEEVIKSQISGVKHKRIYLPYRMQLNNIDLKKRIIESKLTVKQKIVIRLRMKLLEYSHIYFQRSLQKNSWNYFVVKMFPLVSIYKLIYHDFKFFIPRKIRNYLKKLKKEIKII